MSRALIIGAGVSGLTTAWTLADRGFKVTVVAAKYASKNEKLTSQIAGALWEWPLAVCGKYLNFADMDLVDVKRRCLVSFHSFKELAKNPQTGVRMRTPNSFLDDPFNLVPNRLKNSLKLRRTYQDFVTILKLWKSLESIQTME